MYNLLIITKNGQQLFTRLSERDCRTNLKMALKLVSYRITKL